MNRINYIKNTSTLTPQFLLFHIIRASILVLHLRGAERLEDSVKTLWLNALWLLAVNSPPSPLGWPLLWTYEPCRSGWGGETVQGLLIKYYSPLNGWRLASVGMLGLNLPPGQMCECVCEERQCECVLTWRGKQGGQGLLYMGPPLKMDCIFARWWVFCGFTGRMLRCFFEVWAGSQVTASYIICLSV